MKNFLLAVITLSCASVAHAQTTVREVINVTSNPTTCSATKLYKNTVNDTLWGRNSTSGLCAELGGGGTPGGSNTQVQFNDDGVFAGHEYLTIDKVTGIVFVGPVADDSINGDISSLVISGQGQDAGSGQDVTQIYAGTSNPGWIVYPSHGTVAAPSATSIGDWLYNFGVYTYPFGTISAGFLIVQDGATDANGASASFEIQTNNDTRIKITNNATIFSNDVIFSADNTDDIGASGATRPRTGYFGTSVVTPVYKTTTNCADSAGAAACGAAAAGSVVIDAGVTTTVVSTTAVTADSQIHVTFDSGLGTRLGVTCNTTAALPYITARTAATSFTISVAVAPTTNPACLSFTVVN